MGLEERLFSSSGQPSTAAPQTPAAPDADAKGNSNNGYHPQQPSPAPMIFDQAEIRPPPPPPSTATAGASEVPTPSQAPPPAANPHDHASPQSSYGLHGDDFGPPRKRRRPALSCEPCRRRKVRCDRVHPCGPCIRMGSQFACEYDNRFPRPGLPPGANEFPAVATPTYQRPMENQTNSTPSGYEEFEAQVRKAAAAPLPASNVSVHPVSGGAVANGANGSLESSNGHVAHPVNSQREVRDLQSRLVRIEQFVSSQGNGISSRHDQNLLRNVQLLTSRVDQLERQNRAPENDNSGIPHETGLSVPIATPRIKVPVLGENTTKFWGPTHYMQLFDPKSDLFGRMLSSNPKFNLTQVVPSSIAIDGFNHCRKLRQAVKSQTKVDHADSLADILHTLPQLNLRDELVDQYFRTIEELYGVFHRPSFQKQYGTHRGNLDRAPEFVLVQLLLVFAIGVVFVAEPSRSDLRSSILRWVYSAQAWITGPREKTHSGDEWVRCWILLILARQVNSVGTKEQTYNLAGAMLQSARTIGLHRDAASFAGLSPFRIEMRRRLWSAILEISLSAFSDASMPPLISPEGYDCKAPYDIPDNRMDEQSVSLDKAHEPEQSIRTLLRDSYATRWEVAEMLNDFRSPMLYDRLLKLTTDLDAALSRISSFFSKQWQSRTATSSSDFHHKLLALFIHSTQLDLHAAFLAAAKKDPRFHFSRHKALESAMALLASLGNLAHRSPTLDDISKLTLVGSGVFKSSLSMKAIAVVCQELNLQVGEAQTAFSATSREPLFRTLRHVQEQSLNLVKSGDPSCKRYAYLTVTIPMIEARQARRPADEVIASALSDCLRICGDAMTSLLGKQVPPTPESRSDGAIGNTLSTSAGKHSEDLAQFENMDFSFDPSWLLTGMAWHFGNTG